MALGPIVKETLASLIASHQIRIRSYIPFEAYLCFNVASKPVVKPASIYSRIPWVSIVLRSSNRHFRILGRRLDPTMYRYRLRYRRRFLSTENSKRSIFHRPPESFFFISLSLPSSFRSSGSSRQKYSVGTRSSLERNPRIRQGYSGRTGWVEERNEDGGAVPRYNNRAPQLRLADDFIELVSLGPRAQDLPETA